MEGSRRDFLRFFGVPALASFSGCANFLSSAEETYSNKKQQSGKLGDIQEEIDALYESWASDPSSQVMLRNPNRWKPPELNFRNGRPEDQLLYHLWKDERLNLKIIYKGSINDPDDFGGSLEHYFREALESPLENELDVKIDLNQVNKLENLGLNQTNATERIKAVSNLSDPDEATALLYPETNIISSDGIGNPGLDAALIESDTVDYNLIMHEFGHAVLGLEHPYYQGGFMSYNRKSRDLCSYSEACVWRFMNGQKKNGELVHPEISEERAADIFSQNLNYFLQDGTDIPTEDIKPITYLKDENKAIKEELVYLNEETGKYWTFTVTDFLSDFQITEENPAQDQDYETAVNLEGLNPGHNYPDITRKVA